MDIGVPLGVAAWLGAARVAAVRAGRICLIQHEALAGGRVGGHTIAKHVGRTEQQLRARLAAEPSTAICSTFTNLDVAEASISKIMRLNAARIKMWAQSASRQRLVLEEDMGTIAGFGVVRANSQVVTLSKVRLVLKPEFYNGMPYYVLTAYLIQ